MVRGNILVVVYKWLDNWQKKSGFQQAKLQKLLATVRIVLKELPNGIGICPKKNAKFFCDDIPMVI